MAQNFVESRREQGFLLPPDVREWLPADHLAWFVIDAVAEMDVAAFYVAYRVDGHGRAAYEPSMMVALLLYAYATRQRSSRAVERHCRQDVAYRVITGNLIPDHATIARFVERHERALADLFAEVLKLCDRAGLVGPGVVAIDGTRLAGNASPEANVEFDQIAREVLAEARATDEAEDELFGDARGDELPEQLRTAEGRREFFRRARRQRRDEGESPENPEPESDEVELKLDARRIVARTQGREGWLREAKRQLEQHRWRHPDAIARSRAERLVLAAERLEAELDAECRGNEAYEHYRATARDKLGRHLSRPPNLYTPPPVPAGKVNITDPDSRSMPVGFGYVQGYNAQAAVNEQQIVLAAEITNNSTDFSQLDPMTTATLAELQRAGVSELPEAVAADAGYWNEQHMDEVIANKHIPVLIPPDKGSRGTPRPGLGRRALHLDAAGPGHRARPAHLPKTQTDHRAAVRPHQAQPRSQPLPPPRQDRRAHRMAVTDGHPQPHQAPPPPPRRRRALTRPPRRKPRPSPPTRWPGPNHRRTLPQPPEPFERQPPSIAGVGPAS
jgi:transposase